MKLARRRLLQTLGATAATGLALGSDRAQLQAQEPASDGPYFLIVLGGTGGANIVDSLLAIRQSECTNPASVYCFPDQVVSDIAGTDFRAIDVGFGSLGAIPMSFQANQSAFVTKHGADLMAVTHTGTSVNHAVAQRRAVTGNEAWLGRTLQEVVAATYGESFALPNVHLNAEFGFAERGLDETLPAYAFGETVANPILWPLALDPRKGVVGAPSADDLKLARALRNDVLDPNSQFGKVFAQAERLKQWRHQRGAPQAGVEAQNLIDKLLLIEDQALLAQYGLEQADDIAAVRQAFPDLESDPLDAQAALAFLLLKNQVSCTVTLGPSFQATVDDASSVDIRNPPIAFDFSHQDHPSTQAFMWQRLFRIADGLATLLKDVPFGAGSMWDRTMIYFATEFGRTRTKPGLNATSFGSGHELNNGSVIMSPLVQGGRARGGVDLATGFTYGFDRQTGDPVPGTTMTEADIYAGILGALKVDTAGSGLPDVPCMRKS